MTIFIGTLLVISFLGFQLPLIVSAINMHKIDDISAKTIKKAKSLKGGIIQAAFYKSAHEGK